MWLTAVGRVWAENEQESVAALVFWDDFYGLLSINYIIVQTDSEKGEVNALYYLRKVNHLRQPAEASFAFIS